MKRVFSLFSLLFGFGAQAQINSLPIRDFAADPPKKMVLLDVRTAQEYREGHLPKSMNIDWLQSSFATKAAKLPKNQPIYVYCRSGKRSASAAKWLMDQGFEQVINLSGGVMDLSARQLVK